MHENALFECMLKKSCLIMQTGPFDNKFDHHDLHEAFSKNLIWIIHLGNTPMKEEKFFVERGNKTKVLYK